MNCFSSKSTTQTNFIAKFTPRLYMRKHGIAPQLPTLEVTPLGHEYFEDVLMSALIIERVRTAGS